MGEHEAREIQDRPDLIRRRARANFAGKVLLGVLILTTVLTLALVIVSTNSGNADRDRLVECTTPNGRCYQQSQKRTSKLIQQLIDANTQQAVKTRRVVVLAQYCHGLPGVDTVDEILACVNTRMKEKP